MIFPEPLDQALARLSGALSRLQAAAERRVQADALRADLDEELAVLQDDRARLAGELDAALAKVQTVFAVNDEVAARLDRASATVSAVMTNLMQDATDPGSIQPDEEPR